MNLLIGIVGPTASGKTEIAIEIANHFKTEILSADARQVYKGLNIGTAKPTKEQLAKAPHYLLDYIDPFAKYNAGKYEADSLHQLNSTFSKNKIALLVGGTGLYIESVINGLSAIPHVPHEIRQRVETDLKSKGLQNLLDELSQFDKEYYEIVDKANPRRVSRAIEVIRTTQQPFSKFRTPTLKERNFKVILIGLNHERELLYDRINQRVNMMIKEGFIEEVETLLSKGLTLDNQSMRSIGYHEITSFLQSGANNKDELIAKIQQNTRKYAKRQLTWFRNQTIPEAWFHPTQIHEMTHYLNTRIESHFS